MSATADRFIVDWLARAADDSHAAEADWADQGVTLLRCGRAFGVVRIPAPLVQAAMGGEFTPDELRFAVGGAVIHDGPESPYWALIHGHAGLVWDEGDDVPALSDATYISVPSLARTQPPGPHWAVPPRSEGDVCRPSTLRRFIARARQRLAPSEA